MNDIGPGDYVECIDDQPRWKRDTGFTLPIAVGRVYLVTRVGISNEGYPGVKLAGVTLPAPRIWLLTNRFKPIYRRDESLINRLMAPLPAEPDLVLA